MAAMGQYSHVLASATPSRGAAGGNRKLGLVEVSVLAMRAEVSTLSLWRAVVGECLASLLHVLLGCLATLTCPGTRDPGPAHTLLVALCFGLTVAALVQGFQHISGGHLNPVVSLVQAVTGHVTPLRAVLYILAQTGGAVAGASILHGVSAGSCQSELGVTSLRPGLTPWQGLGLEMLLTFLLLFTLCATLDPRRPQPPNSALVLGLTVAGCHLAGYRFTGSSMNPARSLGPAFVSNNWKDHWVYWAGPITGGLVAGLLYEFIFDPSRPRARPRRPPSCQAEDGLTTTTSLITANAATLPSTTTTPRHYYNSLTASSPFVTSTVATNNSHNIINTLLESPRSCRRDVSLNTSSAVNNNRVPLNGSASISSFNNVGNLSTLNHYVAGTYGERPTHLLDSRPTPPLLSSDVVAVAPIVYAPPPIPRRNDVIRHTVNSLPPLRPRPAMTPEEASTPGRENQAYTFESNPLRLQASSGTNVSFANNSTPTPTPSHRHNLVSLFQDDRETICLNDVRPF